MYLDYSIFCQQCDEEVEEKRAGYIQPQDLIYAQPVHLKPVGRPIAAIPLKGSSAPVGPVGYGPPKPVPFPSYGGGGLPPPLPPSRPYKPSLGPVYGGRPPAVYEPIDTIDKKQVLVNPQTGVQQHVHHHYHHTDPEKAGVIDVSGPVYPSGAGGSFQGENSLYANGVGGNGFVGSPSYGGGIESYGSGSSFYKKELNLKGSASSKYLKI